MEFQDVVRRRHMVRTFEDRPIQDAIVQRILDNAQHGPSSGFTQGFEFLVLQGPEQTQRFWEAASPLAPRDRVGPAPLIILPLCQEQVYVDRYRQPDRAAIGRQTAADWPAPYWYIDTAFAALLVLLTAVDAGLGGFYFSIGPTSAAVAPFRSAFGIPDSYYPIGAIAIGYPVPEPPSPMLQRGRRPRTEVMHFGRW